MLCNNKIIYCIFVQGTLTEYNYTAAATKYLFSVNVIIDKGFCGQSR